MLKYRQNDGWLLAGLACVLVACLPLFFRCPLFDWNNHVWMVNYSARYLQNHFCWPSVFNTYELIGMPYPVFYGYLFFKSVGLLSTVFDAEITLRALIVALLAAQFVLLYRTLTEFTNDRRLSFTIGTLVSWAIYPLTDIYHRGAIPEFFAITFLTLACVSWIRGLCSQMARQLALWCNISILALCAASGTHPITAVYGICFYILLVAISVFLQSKHGLRRIFLLSLAPTLIATVSLSSWLYSTVKFHNQLAIEDSFSYVSYYPQSIDAWYLRLSPIPIPFRFLKHKAADEHMGAPHLDAQINIPLSLIFILLLFTILRHHRMKARLSCVLLLLLSLAAFLTYLSITQGALMKFGYYVASIQFGYRLVTYINLVLLFGVLLVAAFASDRARENFRLVKAACLALLALSATALALKLYATRILPLAESHLFAAETPDSLLLHLPVHFYGFNAYATPGLVPILRGKVESSPAVALVPATGAEFGVVQPLSVTKSGSPWTYTNVQPFPWNHLLSNDQEIALAQLRIFGKFDRGSPGHFLACEYTVPTILKYDFEPDRLWLILNAIAFPTFALWSLGTLVVVIKSFRSDRGDTGDTMKHVADQKVEQPT